MNHGIMHRESLVFVVQILFLRGCKEGVLAKTYEALVKAEIEDQVISEEAKVFDSSSHSKPYIPLSFKVPHQIAEEYHRMKHTLLATSPEGKIKTLLFFSST